jgi:hypothetical protein
MSLHFEAPQSELPLHRAEDIAEVIELPVEQVFKVTAPEEYISRDGAIITAQEAVDRIFATMSAIAAAAEQPVYEAPALTVVPSAAETSIAPKFTIRGATPADIEAIVDVDIRSFDSVYTNYDQDEATLRADLIEKFRGRLEKVGSEWMPVLERDSEIVGYMCSCPTSKSPTDFESWEKTTDNGTLDSTYDPNGENVYVVSLAALPKGSDGKDMLYANQIGKMLKEGYKLGFFESRLPGMRDWVLANKCNGSEEEIAGLDPETATVYAKEYFNTYTEYKGKTVRQDPLISFYEKIGCSCETLLPDAYQDEPSMNFGVMCIYDGSKLFDGSDIAIPIPQNNLTRRITSRTEIPVPLPNNRVTRWAFGSLIKGASRSQKLVTKLF